MYQILTLKAKNHVHYKNLKINFRKIEDNLIFITGQNFDTSGSVSNGSGKSVIGDLFTDLLFDKTIRRHSPKSFIGKFAKWSYSYISLKNMITEDIFSIKKYRNHPTKKDKVLFYRISSGKIKKDLSKKKKADTYKVISKELGITWETFKNRNYYGQKDNKRFLNVTDSDKAKIVVDIKNLEDLQECKKISHESLKKTGKEITVIEPRIELLNSQLISYKGSLISGEIELERFIKDIDDRIVSLEEKRIETDKSLRYAISSVKGLKGYRNKFKLMKQEIEDLDRITTEYNKQERILLSMQDFQKNQTEEKKDTNAKILSDKNKTKDVKNQVITKCTECGADLRKKRREKTITVIAKRIKKWEKEICQLDRIIESSKTELIEQTAILNGLSKKKEKFIPTVKKREVLLKKIRKMEKWENTIPIFENQLKEVKEEIEKTFKSKEDPSFKKVVDDLFVKKEEIEKDLKEANLERKRLFLKKAKYSFSEETFEKTIRVLFDDFLNNLNFFSNKYLEIMSDNDIEVNFSPKAERKSKKVVDEINVEVIVNNEKPRPFRTYSGGETGKIEFSSQMALFSSADSPFPLLFMDEPFVGMDRGGIDRAVDLLKQKADEGIRVLVISHEDVISGYGGNINVIRKDGESHLEFS